MQNKKIHFNNLHLYDLGGKSYEVFHPKKMFVEVKLDELKSFGPISDQQEIYEHWGVSFILNSLIALLHCNPDFTMDDITRQFEHIERRLETNGSSIPQWVKEEIFSEITTILDEGLVDDTIEMMKNDERAIQQIGLERAFIIDPTIERGSKEYYVLVGKAKHERTILQRTKQLKDILANWDVDEQGAPTNANLAKYIDLSADRIRQYYSPLIKEEKKMAKQGTKKEVEAREKEPGLYYDINGVGYNQTYLMGTTNEIHFPLLGKYTVTNHGKIYRKNAKGEYKAMSVDNQGLCQLTIEGKRYKVNPKKAMVEVLFDGIPGPESHDLSPVEAIFSMNGDQLQESIERWAMEANDHYNGAGMTYKVLYTTDQYEWMTKVKARKSKNKKQWERKAYITLSTP